MRLCVPKKIKCALFAVSTVQEELGLRGAKTSCFGIDPQVGIAVDVTHGTDYPDIDKRVNGEVKLTGGPTITRGANINPKLEELLRQTAKAKRIACQLEAAPGGTGTDANAMQLNRAGVATALVSIPNRYMHTQVEVVSLSDLAAAAKLLAETVARIDRRTNFIPSVGGLPSAGGNSARPGRCEGQTTLGRARKPGDLADLAGNASPSWGGFRSGSAIRMGAFSPNPPGAMISPGCSRAPPGGTRPSPPR